ncbi:MAG: RHS repeat-associated core domain-containing protein [Prevotellaceae bacterium]|nr:RHS repeat-associated core domain-containing protein [Prevotellaceae bacterium]
MHGLNTYDYGARQYNPVTARWDRIDPFAEKYYGVSPYVYSRNNPIMLIDPEGLTDYTVNENGQMYESTSLWEKIKRLFALGCGADRIFDESTGGLLVSCEEGSIKKLKTEEVTSKEGKKSKHTSFEYSGEKSEDIFQGIINKSKVEWAEIDYKNDGQDNHIFITDHAIDDVSSSANILNTLESQKSTTSFYMKHSHPVSDYDLRSNMSGFINLDPSGPDKKTAQKHPNVIFSVYNMYNHKIQYYNGKGIYKQKGF